MARARNIKPGFFKNDELAELSFVDRLCFIGLWTVADCYGRLEYRPKRIKAELFPYDDVDIEAVVKNLSQYRFIRIYSVQGRQYIEVANFTKHQNPHKNERDKGSDIPEPPTEPAVPVDIQGFQESTDKIGTSTDKIGSDRADSLNLIPDSLNLIPESNAPTGACDSSRKSPSVDAIPYQKIIDLYHEILPGLPKVQKLTTKRRGQIRARWKSGDIGNLAEWREFFQFVGQSKFLTGQAQPMNGRPVFCADIEWLTNETNFAKVWEGKYHGE